MRPKSFISFVGFVMIISATYCPLLRPLHITNWNMYRCNMPYGIVVLVVAIMGLIGLIFMQMGVARLAAWLCAGLVLLFYFLCLLKIHYSFNFIPFHSLESFLDRQIRFKWGWWLLVAGPVLALAGALSERPKFRIQDQPQATNNTVKPD